MKQAATENYATGNLGTPRPVQTMREGIQAIAEGAPTFEAEFVGGLTEDFSYYRTKHDRRQLAPFSI
jgi:hypothetical protein